MESLLGKLSNANEQFSNSMLKIEGLSLNLRHFLLKDNDTTGDYERFLTSMNSSIDKLSVQTKFLETSITKNEDALKVLNEYVNEL